MKLTMLFFEKDGFLHAGYGLKYPALVWRASEHRWTDTLEDFVGNEACIRLSKLEAERCYPGSTSAPLPKSLEHEKEFDYPDLVKFRPDLFDGYDCQSIRKSPSEIRASQELMNGLITRKL